MAERRIQIDKELIPFIRELTDQDGDADKAIFSSMADCITFAAAYGYQRGSRKELGPVASDPIRYDIFERNTYDTFINLLAMNVEKDAHVLADSEDMINKRATIFEEYAKGGLVLLKNELKGSVSYLDPIISIILRKIRRDEGDTDHEKGLDISQLRI